MLVKAMKDDGLHAEITDEGIVWYHGDYIVQQKVIREAWGLSAHQMQKFHTHILETNPFGGHYDWDHYINR